MSICCSNASFEIRKPVQKSILLSHIHTHIRVDFEMVKVDNQTVCALKQRSDCILSLENSEWERATQTY